MKWMSVLMFCALYAILNVGGAALIKRELAISPIQAFKDYIPFLLKPSVIFAFLIILVSALVMFKALSLTKFSTVIPIANGINFGFTVLLGVLLFNDKIGILHLIGLFLILAGIFIISNAEKI
jgi:multidrug transporter EmrE-like cation transporter